MKLPLLLLPLILIACEEEQRTVVNQVKPEDSAKTFAANMNLPIGWVNCTGTDTDCDGYVTCTLSITGDKPHMESIQCAALGAGGWCESKNGNDYSRMRWPYAQGCKLTPVKQ